MGFLEKTEGLIMLREYLLELIIVSFFSGVLLFMFLGVVFLLSYLVASILSDLVDILSGKNSNPNPRKEPSILYTEKELIIEARLSGLEQALSRFEDSVLIGKNKINPASLSEAKTKTKKTKRKLPKEYRR